MKSILFIFSLAFCLHIIAEEKPITICSENLTAERHTTKRISLFTATKGDKIRIKLTVNEKKKSIEFSVIQHPGSCPVYQNMEATALTHEIIVPTDAIYEIAYQGPNADFSLEVLRIPVNAASVTFNREIAFAQVPDTTFNSGYSDETIGYTKKIIPRVQRIKAREITSSEVILNSSFALEGAGQDFLNVDIPATTIDEYRTQELLSWSVTLSIGDQVNEVLRGIVADGLLAGAGKATDLLAGGKGKKNKMNKYDNTNNYDFVDDIGKEQGKWDKTVQSLEIASDAAALAGKGTNNESEGQKLSKGLEVSAYVMDNGGLKQVLIKEGLKQAGVPSAVELSEMVGVKVPSVEDIAASAAAAITPKIKDKVHLKIKDYKTDTYIADAVTGFYTQNFSVNQQDDDIRYLLTIKNQRGGIDAANILSDYVYGNLMIEANYKITDYTDVIFYDTIEEPVTTKHYTCSASTNETAKIMFKDQVKDYYTPLDTERYFYIIDQKNKN